MIFAILLTSLWLFMSLQSYKKIKRINKANWVSLSGRYMFEQFKLEHTAATLIQHLHVNLMLLEPLGWNYKQSKEKIELKFGEVLIVLVGGCWMASLTGETIIYTLALICSSVILLHFYQGTIQKVKQRKNSMIIELPIILTKMTLLIEAGETIMQAFVRCMSDHMESDHPLHREWRIAITMLQNGESFPLVIEKFTKRCSVQVISVLSTYILLNYARGGSYFVTSIQDLMNELWEQRKTIARKKGEEASSKLIFPTIFILLLLMILIVTPAIRLMDVI